MAYDSAITTFTTKTDKVDLVAAAHINSVQSELVTIETILGTNVKGDRTDLKTRLNNALDADGSILSGVSFPSPALPTQGFYRTDIETYYLRNAANTTWNALGSSLSNMVFCWNGKLDDADAMFHISNSLDPNAASVVSADYMYIKTANIGGYDDVLKSKFTKISGINTITWWAYGVHTATGANRSLNVKVDVGGVNSLSTAIDSGQTPEWTSNTLDVSALSNGTTYDITVSIGTGSSEVTGGLGAIILIAS